ncbi:MAG: dihydrolipoamide acetyltransferase family protein [Fidelibacterota bacterium]
MIVDVVMPKLGESIVEGTIIEWRKKVGDTVQKDEILLEIGTDKVDSEIPSPVSGVVVEILANKNDVIPVEEKIARIETAAEKEAEAAPVEAPPEGQKVEEEAKEAREEAKEEKRVTEAEEGKPAVEEPSPGPQREPEKAPEPGKKGTFYTPLVRAIARREKISEAELASIAGSGRGGRVTKKDVLAYLGKRPEVPRVEAPPAEAPPVGLEEEIVEMDRVRQLIAEHMRRSLDTAAHVHLVSECDVTHLATYVQGEREAFEKREGFRLTFTPFFVLAAVKTIHDYPIFNASLDGTRIVYRKNVNFGLAVATPRGLMVPVIRNCEELNFLGTCRKVNDLAVRTRDGKISPEELQGSTISLTNYGVFGNLMGTPVINQPNVAIIGIGAVKKRPVVRETADGDTLAIRSMVYLSLGFDHRLIDGAGGGQFLKSMVHYLETMDTESLL